MRDTPEMVLGYLSQLGETEMAEPDIRTERQIMEAEATRFATELLMPAEWVKRDIAKMEFDLCDDRKLKLLASRYGVSVMLMSQRIADLREWLSVAKPTAKFQMDGGTRKLLAPWVG